VRFEQILLAERPAALRFSHRGSARTLDVARFGEQVAIVSERIAGWALPLLFARLDQHQGRPGWGTIAWIGLELVRVLGAAHRTAWAAGQSKGMLHGALAPDEIYIQPDGRVKLTAVGLGRSRLCLPTALARLRFRAPELGERQRADAPCDIFALGRTLADLLPPDPGARASGAADLAEVRSVPTALHALLAEMQAPLPAERPSAAKVEAVLEGLVGSDEDAYAQVLASGVALAFPTQQRWTGLPPQSGSRQTLPLRMESGGALADELDLTFEAPVELEPVKAQPVGTAPQPSARAAKEADPLSLPPSPLGPVSVDLARELRSSSAPQLLQPAPYLEPLKAGDVINHRYRLVDVLGEGGASVVYRVEHVQLQKMQALKVLRPEHSVHSSAVARFQREARSVCQLDHPNIVRVTDFGQAENGAFYLVMDLVEGESLYRRLQKEGAIQVRTALELVSQVLSGLGHAHEKGVVHRDLKPDNIMVVQHRDGPKARILDFGIAKVNEPGERRPSLSATGAVFGTPRYMSPEQAAGDPVDQRSDLFSVGVILFELLTGRVPFDGETTFQVLSKVISEQAPPLIVPGLPPDLVLGLGWVLNTALAKDRSRRFSSAEAFRSALAAFRTE
jgi:serine/threonine protein kinase